MNLTLRLLALLLLLPATLWAAEITPSDVYAQASRIEQETALLKRHFKVAGVNESRPVEADIKPRHVWAKTYNVLVKISLFRKRHGLSYVEPAYLEPSQEITPAYVWEQSQRILTEIAILKRQLGIPGQGGAAAVSGKRAIDVFNLFERVSADWSLLLGGHLTPSEVYGEAMRLNSDVDLLLRHVHVIDSSGVPKKNLQGTPDDSLRAAFEVLAEVQRLQRQLNIPVSDLSAFRKDKDAAPEDVFNLVGLTLAEVQTLKAQLGLRHEVTPGAVYAEGKKPADVAQTLGYVRNKLRLIRLQ